MLNLASLPALALAASLSLGTPSMHAADATRTSSAAQPRSTFIVHHGVNVKIDADAGNVQVKTWMFDKVGVTSTTLPEGIERTMEQNGNTVLVHIKQHDAASPVNASGLSHTIYVPASAHVEAFVSNGSAEVNGVYGSVAVHAEGDIRLQDVSNLTESSSALGKVVQLVPDPDGVLVEQAINNPFN